MSDDFRDHDIGLQLRGLALEVPIPRKMEAWRTAGPVAKPKAGFQFSLRAHRTAMFATAAIAVVDILAVPAVSIKHFGGPSPVALATPAGPVVNNTSNGFAGSATGFAPSLNSGQSAPAPGVSPSPQQAVPTTGNGQVATPAPPSGVLPPPGFPSSSPAANGTPTIRFTTASNGQHFTVTKGTAITVYLATGSGVTSWSVPQSGNTTVIKPVSSSYSANGSVTTHFTAAATSSVAVTINGWSNGTKSPTPPQFHVTVTVTA